MESRTHIALVSIPAFSHQVSILEFAKRLLHLHQDQFQITCIIPTLVSPTTSSSKLFFDSLPPTIQCIFLPPPNSEDLRNVTSLEIQLQLSITHSLHSIQETLKSLHTTNNFVALIVDAMAPQVLAFGKELNTFSYIYFACSAMILSLCIHSPKLDETVPCEYSDHPKLIEIPGCISVHGKDLPNSVQERSSLAYKLFLQRCKEFCSAEGILVNTFVEMEEGAIRAIQESSGGNNPHVYPIGPITQTGSGDSSNNGWECLTWLNTQPPNSVLFISFGSGGTLSQEQINELALGLELSEHRFLWVNVREPNDRPSASYFSDEKIEPLEFLPSGFLERTKGKGLVMCSWAPQVEVLSHKSVGGFLTHCGWNSILEGIVHGVPMVAWPLFAEQRTNAALVNDGLKVALRPKISGNNGLVVKEEIASVIKRLFDFEGLEGCGIRERMKELTDAAACATMENGSSTKTISMLASTWKNWGRTIEK